MSQNLLGQVVPSGSSLDVQFVNTGTMGPIIFYVYAKTRYSFLFSRQFVVNVVYNCRFDRLTYKVFDKEELKELKLPRELTLTPRKDT